MKRILLLIIISISFSMAFAGTAESNGLANSFYMRAIGSDAVYWNPSLLYNKPEYNIEFTLPSFELMFVNNAISIRDYDKYNGTFLSQNDKDDILDILADNLYVQAQLDMPLFSSYWNQNAIAVGMHVFGKGELDKQFADLLLNGNEYDEVYHFTEKNTNFGSLAYADFTYGNSKMTIQDYFPKLRIYDYIPEVQVGFSVSVLAGLFHSEMTSFDAIFQTDDFEGMSFKMDSEVKNAVGGYGLKGNLGFSSEVYPNLNVGMGFDNILGFIKWTGTTEMTTYSVREDSIFVADLGDDLFDEEQATSSIGEYETILPTTFRFGASYYYYRTMFSLDWKKAFQETKIFSDAHYISTAAEVQYFEKFPIRFGIEFGNKAQNFRTSYGLGMHFRHYQIDFGFQSIGSLFPNDKSKGVSFGITQKIKF